MSPKTSSAEPIAIAENSKQPSPATQRYQTTVGERVSDLLTFGGLGFLANELLSLVTVRYAVQKPGNWLHRFGEKSQAGFEMLFSHMQQNPLKVRKWADLANNVLFLGFAGWALVVPMKWLEDNKLKISQSVDRFLGTGPKTPEDAIAQAERLDTGPKQDYISLFGGRTIAYAATIAAALPFITETTTINARFNRFLNKWIGPHMGKLREPLLKETVKIDGREIERVTDIPAFIDSISKETILSGTSAFLHYASSSVLAHVKHHVTGSQTAQVGTLSRSPTAKLVSADNMKALHDGVIDASPAQAITHQRNSH